MNKYVWVCGFFKRITTCFFFTNRTLTFGSYRCLHNDCYLGRRSGGASGAKECFLFLMLICNRRIHQRCGWVCCLRIWNCLDTGPNRLCVISGLLASFVTSFYSWAKLFGFCGERQGSVLYLHVLRKNQFITRTVTCWIYLITKVAGGLFFAAPMRSRGYKTLLDPFQVCLVVMS